MPVTKTIVYTPDAGAPLPIFSQAVISRGNVYVSGSIGVTNDSVLVEGGVQPQTRAALENIAIILKAAGSGLEHIVKVNIYLANLPRDYDAFNEIYIQFFDKDTLPQAARTCIGVASLPIGADVEIECFAEIP